MYCPKKALSLFELILVTFISGIVLIYTFNFLKEVHQTQEENAHVSMLKIDLNATKIIINNRLPHSKDVLTYDGTTLYYNHHILLQNVTHFQKNQTTNKLILTITLENRITQTWEFAL